ncbi:MAG: NAD(P)H-hydrate dehydratase [Pseudomonadota bacterium]
MELLTASQMRALEEAAIHSAMVTGLELMERAGRGAVDAIFARWPELAATPEKGVIFCGPGNNGGDGFVIARLLAEWGWEIEVCLFGDPARLPPDARANHDRWLQFGPVARVPTDGLNGDAATKGAALVVDALFGIGLTRAIDVPLNSLMLLQETAPRPRLVAIDVPSGLCADSGRVLQKSAGPNDPIAVCADLTVTFHTKKPGHLLALGPSFCGDVAVVDIGLGGAEQLAAVSPNERVSQIGRPSVEKRSGHKFDHGHALVLSGPMGRSGAARLAARGALRIGAGLVTVGAPGSAMLECACQLTAIMLQRIESAENLDEFLRDPRTNALCIGPGLGTERARDLVPVALATGRAAVLDADALTAYGDAPTVLFEQIHGQIVLTPHHGEFARLFPDLAQRLTDHAPDGPAFSKVDAVRAAALRAGCTILLKGPDTVIVGPDGRAAIHAARDERAVPWLATAGAGDVLAGMIAGLLARGFDPIAAAEAAAWLHVEAARSRGAGLIAEDIPEAIPAIIGGSADYC